jgi:hypothetical protein
MALPQTITVPLATRSAGTYTIPAQSIPVGYTVAQFVFILDVTSYADALLVLSGLIETSSDGGGSWISFGSFGFHGGGVLGVNGPPGITVYRPAIEGLLVRASLTLNRTATIGGSVTLT